MYGNVVLEAYAVEEGQRDGGRGSFHSSSCCMRSREEERAVSESGERDGEKRRMGLNHEPGEGKGRRVWRSASSGRGREGARD